MNKFVYFLFLVFFNCIESSKGSSSRIVGGLEAPPKFGLFHASLQNVTGHHVCGAAVVSRKHLVTAAHCVINADPRYIKVVVGTTNLDIKGKQYNVESIFIHGEYDASVRQNDIAVLKIRGAFNSKDTSVLELSKKELQEGDPVTLTGFGAKEGDSGGPIILENKLVGIISWGIPCAVGFPDVHTRISPYVAWISDQILKK